MTPACSLSFSLNTRALPSTEGAPARDLATLLPLIDGEALFGDVVPHVDTLELLVSGQHSGDMELCTCSCGVAECAGFWEPVRVQVSKSHVTWHVPAEGYARVVDAAAFGDGPWTFTFDRSAYFEALAQAERQCVSMQGTAPSLVFSPAYEEAEDEPVRPPASLASILAVCRPAKALEVAARQTLERAAGSVLGRMLHLTVAGRTWKVYPEAVLGAFAQAEGLPRMARAQRELPAFKLAWRRGAEQLQADPVGTLLKLPEDSFPTGFPVDPSSDAETLDRSLLLTAEAVQVEWVPAP